MSEIIKHKRVEFTELFYDLVLVYAIAKSTGLIYQSSHGIVAPIALLTFITCLLVLVNTWMIQTVFTNRYGKNSLFNMIIMFVNMAFLLMIANRFTLHWQSHFHTFAWIISLQSLSLFIQYLVQYFHKDSNANDQYMITGFFYILGSRALFVAISAILPYQIGIWLYFFGIFFSFLLPIAFNKKMRQVPINFPHLVERISLLVIITFGEMIMKVGENLSPEHFSIKSLLYFAIVVLLFLYYFGEFDHSIDQTLNTLGLTLIYSHYFIFTGILMLTSALTLAESAQINHYFLVCYMYTATVFYFFGIALNNGYNQKQYQWPKSYLIFQAIAIIGAFIMSIFLASQLWLVIAIFTTLLFVLEYQFLRFYLRSHKESGDDHPIYLI